LLHKLEQWAERSASEGLEPYAWKLASTVLRGLGAGDSPRLLGLLNPSTEDINKIMKDTHV